MQALGSVGQTAPIPKLKTQPPKTYSPKPIPQLLNPQTMSEKFEFENLKVWQRSVDFIDTIFDLLENINSTRKHFRLMEQIEASGVSVAANIAEGKGRHSDKEYLKFLYYSRGSLYETVTLLQVFQKRRWISEQDYANIQKEAILIGKMLNALIRSVRNRLGE